MDMEFNMSKPEISIVDAMTNEQIVREMTTAEFNEHKANMEKSKAEELAKEADEAAKLAAKQTILDRLGLTADELKTILG